MVIPMLLAHICHVSLTCADMATVMPMRSAYYAHAFHAYMPCRPHVRRFGHGYAQTQLCQASCVLVCPHAKEQNKNRVEQPVLSLLLLPLFLHIDDARRILPLPSRRCFQQQFASHFPSSACISQVLARRSHDFSLQLDSLLPSFPSPFR
jgi:hypothetical protein